MAELTRAGLERVRVEYEKELARLQRAALSAGQVAGFVLPRSDARVVAPQPTCIMHIIQGVFKLMGYVRFSSSALCALWTLKTMK